MPPFEIDEFKQILEDESQEGHSEVMGIINNIVSQQVEGLQTTNQDLKEEKRKLQEILDGMPGNDELEKMRQLQERLDSSEDARLIAEGKMDEVINARTERYRSKIESRLKDVQEENKKLVDTNKELKNSYDSFRVDNAIKSAAMEEGVVPTAIDDLALRLSRIFRVEDGKIVGRDESGDYIRNEENEKMGVKDYIKSLKEDAPHFWPPSSTSGLHGGSEQLESSMYESAEKGNAGDYGDKRREQLRRRREEKMNGSRNLN
jgi:hypothetical protein